MLPTVSRRGPTPASAPESLCTVLDHEGLHCNWPEMGAPGLAWLSPAFETGLCLRGNIRENLRLKSPPFVPEVRTMIGGGVAGFRHVGWGIIKWGHLCLNPPAQTEQGLSTPRPRTAAKLPALSKCASPISPPKKWSQPRCEAATSGHSSYRGRNLGLKLMGRKQYIL